MIFDIFILGAFDRAVLRYFTWWLRYFIIDSISFVTKNKLICELSATLYRVSNQQMLLETKSELNVESNISFLAQIY